MLNYSLNRLTSRLQVKARWTGKKKGLQAEACNPLIFLLILWGG